MEFNIRVKHNTSLERQEFTFKMPDGNVISLYITDTSWKDSAYVGEILKKGVETCQQHLASSSVE